LNKDEWASILKLSHLWGFTSFCTATISKLESLLSAVDKIVLGRTCDVQHWLQPAFEEVCSQANWLSDDDCQQIGLEDVMKIARAREILRGGAQIVEDKEQTTNVVQQVFKLGSAKGDDLCGFSEMVDELKIQ
jgi:hypothetical protein